MKNVISGWLLLSLLGVGWAEPAPKPAATTVPTTPGVTAPAQTEGKPAANVKEDAPPIASAKPEKEKPRKKKEPLVIKFRDF